MPDHDYAPAAHPADAPWRVDRGDCLEWLAALPEGGADLLFCSPPYEQARLYLEGGADLGVARDTEEWVAWMVRVCHAARRACKGLCAFVVEGQTRDYRYTCSPFLLVADLHRAGFHLRKPPAYRRVGIPGSGGPDWLRNDYEPVVCFTRGGRLPWSDNTACGHPPKWGPGGEMSNRKADGSRVNAFGMTGRGHARSDGKVAKQPGKFGSPRKRGGERESQGYNPPALANPGNVIDCGAAGGGRIGSELAHQNEAPFPEALAEFFVRSFCPPGGLVIDPFSGSGTTGAVAVRLRRRFLGCDLRESQVTLARRRISEETPLLLGYGEDAPPPPTESEAPGA